MKPTIQALWDGNIVPGPNCGAGDTKTERLSIQMDDKREKLEGTLSEEHRRLLKKYIDCTDEYVRMLTAHAFSDGFCLASRLLTEALSEE